TGLKDLRFSIAVRSNLPVPPGSLCARRSSSDAGRPMRPHVAQSPRLSSRAWQYEQWTSKAPWGLNRPRLRASAKSALVSSGAILRRHPRVLAHVAQDGRLHEPAALELLALGTLPAGEHLGAAFHGVGDLRLDFRALPLGVQRTHLHAFLEAVADGPLLLRAVGDLCHELLGDRFEEVHALHREAGLPRVEEASDRGRGGRAPDIGVVADD